MSEPITVVQRQLDAYNAHDLEAFSDTYARDVTIDLRDGTRMTGREALRERYGPVFEQGRCRAEIAARMTEGDWVIDHEIAHGIAEEPVRVLVAYRVRDGRIDTVRFFG